MTYTWGQYTTGALESVNREYDAPTNEIVEVHQIYGVPAGIPGITESILFNDVKSAVESKGATLTYCQINIDWGSFRTDILYQYKSPGLVVALIVLAVIAVIVIIGLVWLSETLYKVTGGSGGVTLVLMALVLLGAGVVIVAASPYIMPFFQRKT